MPLSRMLQKSLEVLQQIFGVDIAKSLIGGGRPSLEIWNGPTGQLLAAIRDHHAIGFSPDGKTFATQDESYNIFFWDLPPRRNWPLAAGLAIVPAVIATAVLLAVIALCRRILRRVRPVPVKSD